MRIRKNRNWGGHNTLIQPNPMGHKHELHLMERKYPKRGETWGKSHRKNSKKILPLLKATFNTKTEVKNEKKI